MNYLKNITNYFPSIYSQPAAPKIQGEPYLDKLPEEMIVEIFRLLDVRSLCQLSQTSPRFKAVLTKHPEIWEELFYKAFPSLRSPQFPQEKFQAIGYQNLVSGKGWEQIFSPP